MESFNDTDPIWGLPAHSAIIGPLLTQYSNDRIGRFATTPGLSEYLKNWRERERAKLTSWILDHNRGGGVPVVNAQDLAIIADRPGLSFSEKVDRFLLMLESDKFQPGDPLPWRSGLETEASVRARHRAMLWMEAASDQEFYALRSALVDAGILIGDTPEAMPRLGPRGYTRMEELRSTAVNSNQGFVAMWFGDEVSEAYAQGIEPALADAGYRAMRIDRKEHNNKIDDEILAEIRRSRFVVADFTCGLAETPSGAVAIARGGVYYEAGFAQGLGIPVIWCVRADQVGLVHFDTRQFNHVTWSTPEDLRERLTARIAASIGWGPVTGR